MRSSSIKSLKTIFSFVVKLYYSSILISLEILLKVYKQNHIKILEVWVLCNKLYSLRCVNNYVNSY